MYCKQSAPTMQNPDISGSYDAPPPREAEQGNVFTGPDWLLSSYQPALQTFTFMHTRQDIIEQSAFLDGRTPLSPDGDIRSVPVVEALAWLEKEVTPTAPDRMIAHISFCGSTLLARCLQIPSCSLSYREPQILVELANLKATNHPITRDRDLWPQILRFALSQFRKGWGFQAALVKPSNWMNNLLPDLLEASPQLRLITMHMPLKDYLLANMRGGKSRLDYSLNLLNHLLHNYPRLQGHARETGSALLPPLEQMLRFLAILYQTQLDIFTGLETRQPLGKDTFLRDPAAELLCCADHLALPMTDEMAAASVERNLGFYSKDQQQKFDADAEAQENRRLLKEFKPAIRKTLDWADRNLG